MQQQVNDLHLSPRLIAALIKKTENMLTTIDNNQRKFLIQSQGFSTTDIFCNLKDIPKVLKEGFEPHEQFIVFEYWNRKLKRCSKKHLNDMFTANQVDYKIK